MSFAPRLIVFDLDGTLIDSRIDLCNSVNATLAHFGRQELPEAVIASFIGDGASMLVRRALGDPEGDVHDEEFVAEALTFFLEYYKVHKLDFTYVYPGVTEALAEIDPIAAEWFAVVQDFARVGGDDSGQTAEQRGFSRPVRPQNGHDSPRRDL